MRNQKNNQYEIKNKNKKNFTIIEDAIILDERLNNNEKILLIFYIKTSELNNYSYYSTRQINKILKIDRETIKKYNEHLEYLKYIKITKRFNKSNLITINKIKNDKSFFKIIKQKLIEIDNLTWTENPTASGRKFRPQADGKSASNNNNNNINNNDFNLKNKNTYTEQDEIEINKIKKLLTKNKE